MDPDIAAAQAVTENHKRKLVAVADGCDLFLKKIEREKGRTGAHQQYSVAVKHLKEWTDRLRTDHIQDITSEMLERWYSEKPWSEFSVTTRRQVWINIRSIFKFWFERGLIERNTVLPVKPVKRPEDHVQGPYTDQQVAAILRQVDAEADPRLRAFVIHLLHVGCDVVDAVRFNTKRIEDVTVDGRKIHIYRYKRMKTKVTALVKLSAAVAKELRSVPRLADSPDGMPFRNPGVELNSDRSDWSKRVIAVLHAAEVEWVAESRPIASNFGIHSRSGNCAMGKCLRTLPRCWGTSMRTWFGSTMLHGCRILKRHIFDGSCGSDGYSGAFGSILAQMSVLPTSM